MEPSLYGTSWWLQQLPQKKPHPQSNVQWDHIIAAVEGPAHCQALHEDSKLSMWRGILLLGWYEGTRHVLFAWLWTVRPISLYPSIDKHFLPFGSNWSTNNATWSGDQSFKKYFFRNIQHNIWEMLIKEKQWYLETAIKELHNKHGQHGLWWKTKGQSLSIEHD